VILFLLTQFVTLPIPGTVLRTGRRCILSWGSQIKYKPQKLC